MASLGFNDLKHTIEWIHAMPSFTNILQDCFTHVMGQSYHYSSVSEVSLKDSGITNGFKTQRAGIKSNKKANSLHCSYVLYISLFYCISAWKKYKYHSNLWGMSIVYCTSLVYEHSVFNDIFRDLVGHFERHHLFDAGGTESFIW